MTVALSLQVMTPGLYYYYSTELAFYWSLVFSQFTDIKRKVRGTGVVSALRQQLQRWDHLGRSHGCGRGGERGELCTRIPCHVMERA